MSDEPDLGDEFKGIGGDYEHIQPITQDMPIFTRAQMTAAIQANLKAREELQREIAEIRTDMDELEDDLMYAKDALRDVLGWIECSQSRSALEAIVKRGLKE
jgi:hypothetical protein